MKRIIPTIVLATLLAVVINANLATQNILQAKQEQESRQQELVQNDLKASEPVATKKVAAAKVVAAKAVVAPPKQAAWDIESTPGPRVKLRYVNQAVAYYQNLGMTKQGVAMLVGNYLQEMPIAFVSGNPCDPAGYGDGGRALGFAQWHPGRRVKMPCGFHEQLGWALGEMKRHHGGKRLRPLLFDSKATVDQIHIGIKGWEVYGVAGNRYQYGKNILKQL